MKKIVSIFLSVVMLFSVVSCGLADTNYMDDINDTLGTVSDNLGSLNDSLENIKDSLGNTIKDNSSQQEADSKEEPDSKDESSKTQTDNNKIDGDATVSGIKFSQLSVKKSKTGNYNCDVNLTNNTGKDLNNVMFRIVFYDDSDNRICVAGPGAIATSFKNGDTKTASLMVIDEDLSTATKAKYEFVVDPQ